MEIGLVRRVDIDHEMQQSYLDYAMSVIVARALPDARDGLKPVQRRILYGMYDMGLRADTAHKKSARIVGEVLGKYHPHGDQAVYEAMARMAQEFSMRYPLVDGQGNFGSVDGDPPAAMRYTEARLTRPAVDMLLQLDRNTIDFIRNFDDSLDEPDVLPAAIPNLLVNGASGIAVGMATSIPPHNLTEVIDALVFMLNKWEHLEDIAVDDLMKFIKGPDFPTGGIILQENSSEDLLSAYATGRGKVTLRGKVQLEEMGRGKSRIIITELPYQINKASLIERIAELAREGNLEGISDLRDESDRQGMRIVIELNKVAEEENVLRELYKRTPLQSTFRISLLALVNGEPHLLALKPALRVYLEHRIEVIRRRSAYDLERARQRAHILEGLRIALKNLDEIINLIRKAEDVEDARTKLMKRYKLSEIQANAILEMQLRRLSSLERKKIELEYHEITDLIKKLEDLLLSPEKLRQVVSDELLLMKQSYGDRRRTQIVSLKEGETMHDVLTTTDLVPEQPVWVGVTEAGQVGRTHNEKFPKDGTQPRWACLTSTHQTLYLAATDGRTAAVSVQSLPEIEDFENGVSMHRVSPFEEGLELAGIFCSLPKDANPDETFIMTVSRNGMVKKSVASELPGPSTQLFTLARVNPGNSLRWMFWMDGQSEIVLATRRGMLIRFSEDSVRPMGLVAAGVNGIKLADPDSLAGAFRYNEKYQLLMVGSNGQGWRLPADQLVLQGRYGQGTIGCRPEPGVEVVGLLYGPPKAAGSLIYVKAAPKIIHIDQIPPVKRLAAGKALAPVKAGDAVQRVIDLPGEGAAAGKTGPVSGSTRSRRSPAVPGGEAIQPALTGIMPGELGTKTAAKRKSPAAKSTAKTETASTRKTTGAQKTEARTRPAAGGAKSTTRSKPAASKAAPAAKSKPAASKTKPAAGPKPAASSQAPKKPEGSAAPARKTTPRRKSSE